VIACSDAIPERATKRAAEFGVPRACTLDELLADRSVELVLNLTIPAAHEAVARAAVESGKSVYSEKPLSIDFGGGLGLVALARQRGGRVGGAPDTFLGGGIQTCRRLLDEGAIGRPIGASAFFANHGPEHWHPDPAFYYQRGGGPMYDMGPYYLTALVSLLGPIRGVTGLARASFDERTITSEAKNGQKVPVETPTHVAGVLDFANGAIGTILTSFDVWGNTLPRIEIYGSEGTLIVPDPNTFGGPVRLRTGRTGDWREMPLSHPNTENSRGIGLADMAVAMRAGRPHRANGDLTLHVLEAMHGVHVAASTGHQYAMTTTCERPAPIPPFLPANAIDA
jgi:predicted dehydrogenase